MGNLCGGVNNNNNNNTNNEPVNKLFKVCISGKTTVGKTSIILRYIENIFLEGDIQMNEEYKEKLVKIDNNTNVKLQIFDTGGTEKFREITVSYYRGAQAVIIVFSLAEKESFDEIEHWHRDVEKYAPGCTLFIAGNKSDLPRVVSEDEIKNKCSTLDARYFEISAKNSNGVTQMFEELGKSLNDENRL